MSLKLYDTPAFHQVGGKWQALSDSLSTVSSAGAVVAAGQYAPVTFGSSASDLFSMSLGGGKVTMSAPGLSVHRPQVTGEVVTYQGVAADTNLEYLVSAQGVDKQLVLLSPKAPTSFVFHLSDPAGVLGAAVAQPDGSTMFGGTAGNGAVLVVPPASAWSQPTGGGEVPADPSGASESVVRSGDGYDLTVSLTPGWAAGKSYPIVLDPSLAWWGYLAGSPLPTLEGYNSDCAPTSCPKAMSVGNYLFTGSYNNVVRARSYAEYDLKQSTSAYVPDRAQITSAGYQLYFDACIGNAISQNPYQDLCTQHAAGKDLYTVELDRMAGSWNYSTTEPALAALAAPANIAAPQVRTTQGRDNALNWNITSLVQNWVDFGQSDYQPNFGVQIWETGDSNLNDGGPVFDSSTHVNEGYDNGGSAGRPILAVSWNEVPPGAPTGLTATPTLAQGSKVYTQAALNWTIPTTGTEPSDYLIKATNQDTGAVTSIDYARSQFGVCGGPLVACTGQMSYTVAGLTAGDTYTFTVQAANAGGAGGTATATATLWVGPNVTMPAPPSTTSGNQAAWQVQLQNTDDQPVTATMLLALPPELGLAPLTGSINTNGTANAPCVTVTSFSATGAGDCFYDVAADALYTAVSIGAGKTTTVTFDAVATTASLTCKSLVFTEWTVIPQGVGSTGSLGITDTACNAGLGEEPWWSFVDRPLGPQATASVNVANGNLVVSQTDTTPVQGDGQLDYSLTRSYNSQLTSTQSAASIGAGWQLNLSDLGVGAPAGVDSLLTPLLSLGVNAKPLQDTLLEAPVTLVNPDGSRDTFTPATTSVGLQLKVADTTVPNLLTDVLGDGLGGLYGTLQSILEPNNMPLPVPNGSAVAVCLATGYNPPPGVHESLWRFVAVSVPSGSTACTPQTGSSSLVSVSVGYAVMRPDRTTEVFDFNGNLQSVFDRAGNEMRYTYNTNNQLSEVYEAAATRRSTPPAGTSA